MTAVAEQTKGLGREFRTLWLAALVAGLGAGIGEIAFPWLATSLTRDPVLIAGVNIALELPWLLISLPVGALIDRGDSRSVIVATSFARAVLLVAIFLAIMLGAINITLLVLAAFVLGSLQVGYENADQTFLPRIVRSDQLERANSSLVVAQSISGGFAGPWVGGLLIGLALAVPFATEAALLLVATGLVVTIKVPPPVGRPKVPEPLRQALAVGIRHFWNHHDLRSLGLLLGLVNLAGGIAFGTQVLFAQEILGLDAAGYGLLFSIGAVGGLVGSQVAPWLERRHGPRVVLLITLAGNAAGALAIGLTSSTVIVAAAVTVSAALALIWNIITISYRQRVVPEDRLGRVNSIYRLLAWGPLPLGSLISGLLVSYGEAESTRELGLRLPLFASATLTTVAFFAALLWLRLGARSGGDPQEAAASDDGTERDR